MTDCEVPPAEYYIELQKDLIRRHPKACRHVIEHLVVLEAFFDNSIVAGFSYGVAKAQLLKVKAVLLGNLVGRFGSTADPEKTEAIMNFDPLREQTHVRQFLGCTNWTRWFLPEYYPIAAKILGQFNKAEACFPPEGLGGTKAPATTDPKMLEGHNAVLAIKLMARHCVNRAVMDVAGAIDGSRPLELIAGACGYGWGGVVVQMNADMTNFNVLLIVGGGFTDSHQN